MDTNTNLQKKLSDIQVKLNVPKSQTNSFGNYKYRSAEDILDAVKPLLGDAVLTVSDDLVLIGDRYYVKATATIALLDQTVSTTAFAREEEAKKGMDSAQITGSTSSYARKYALNGLFCIDDTKDPDTRDNSDKTGTVQKKMPLKTAEQKAQDNELTVSEEDELVEARKTLFRQMYAIWGSLGKNTDDAKKETATKYKVAYLSQMTAEELQEEIASLKKVQEAKEFTDKIKDPTVNF